MRANHCIHGTYGSLTHGLLGEPFFHAATNWHEAIGSKGPVNFTPDAAMIQIQQIITLGLRRHYNGDRWRKYRDRLGRLHKTVSVVQRMQCLISWIRINVPLWREWEVMKYSRPTILRGYLPQRKILGRFGPYI